MIWACNKDRLCFFKKNFFYLWEYKEKMTEILDNLDMMEEIAKKIDGPYTMFALSLVNKCGRDATMLERKIYKVNVYNEIVFKYIRYVNEMGDYWEELQQDPAMIFYTINEGQAIITKLDNHVRENTYILNDVFKHDAYNLVVNTQRLLDEQYFEQIEIEQELIAQEFGLFEN